MSYAIPEMDDNQRRLSGYEITHKRAGKVRKRSRVVNDTDIVEYVLSAYDYEIGLHMDGRVEEVVFED